MVAREGSNVTMRCAAKGTPEPKIIWKREGGASIPLGPSSEGEHDPETGIIASKPTKSAFLFSVASVEGSIFNISRVSRLHMGAYLCIAYNGVPPSVSKRITLIVHCKYQRALFECLVWANKI